MFVVFLVLLFVLFGVLSEVVLLPDTEVVLFFAVLLFVSDDFFAADGAFVLDGLTVVDGFFVADGAAVPAGFFEPAEAEADGAAVAGCFPTVTYCGDAL